MPRWGITYRPQNQCDVCNYTWHPRGKNVSLRCPACGARSVSIPARPSVDTKGCGIVAAAVLGIPFGICILSNVVSSLASHGRGALILLAIGGAIAGEVAIVLSVVKDFSETGGDFDSQRSVLMFLKLLSSVVLAIAIIAAFIRAVR